MKHLAVTEARVERAEKQAQACEEDRLEIWKALAKQIDEPGKIKTRGNE